MTIERTRNEIYIHNRLHGSRKTTIGKALSKELQMDVVDTDQKIEEKQEKAIENFCRRRRNGFSGI